MIQIICVIGIMLVTLIAAWIVIYKMPTCCHIWEEVERIRITDDGVTVGHKHVMRCAKCGWKKVVKV
ncbi:MAG: hypothetical protein VXW65_05435 [Pseudomonadota bacterium]|nr:hypothetical protein [Pseudomonadota bacterium]